MEGVLGNEPMPDSRAEECLRQTGTPRDGGIRESLLPQEGREVVSIPQRDVCEPLFGTEEVDEVSLSVPVEDFG